MITRRGLMKTMAGASLAMMATGVTDGAARGGIDYGPVGADVRRRPPAAEGFRFPAEWAPHERTLMQFLPAQNWPPANVSPARREWAAVANAVAQFEPVTMAVRPEDRGVAKALLSADIDLVDMPMNDGWSRDSGPMILVNDGGERAVAGFTFNSWGRKFRPYDDDALLKARLAKHFDLPFYQAPMVLEGGAVAVDGDGTCLTTAQCLLNANRNPGATRESVEQILAGWLGVETVIWLDRGLLPDPITDGHVDGLAAFAGPGLVLLHTTYDRSDPNYAITKDAKHRLHGKRDAKGRPFEVVEIPLTGDVSHLNFYICNGGVIVPAAGNAAQDDVPLGILRDIFPDRDVVPVPGRAIASGGGGVHCITQQMPAV